MNDLIHLLGNFGFPIFMVLYLLGRFENSFKNMTNSFNQLERTMVKHFNKK
ncbi:YvrJ family protein [Aerococcaceae bacterium NML180378]|nr:YvrJ family protein [Aerococcaceae bacterium NML180378]